MQMSGKLILKLACILATAILLLGGITSCSGTYGVVVGTRYIDDHYGHVYFNGDRRGDYIYYRGRWYLYGIGTPYEWDPYYEPYIYY
jgi:hypothetical protein